MVSPGGRRVRLVQGVVIGIRMVIRIRVVVVRVQRQGLQEGRI